MTLIEGLTQIWQIFWQLVTTNHAVIFLMGCFLGHIVQLLIDEGR